MSDSFNYDEYLKRIRPLIIGVITRKRNDSDMSDILLDPIIDKYKKHCKYVKQLQMNVGEIWQIVIGEYDGYKNLKVGHCSKMDVYHKKSNVYIELKNRYNTDNSSSRSANYTKMVDIMKQDSSAICIYGIINDKNQKGSIKEIEHKGHKIKIYSGNKLLKYIFGEKYKEVIAYVAEILREHITID